MAPPSEGITTRNCIKIRLVHIKKKYYLSCNFLPVQPEDNNKEEARLKESTYEKTQPQTSQKDTKTHSVREILESFTTHIYNAKSVKQAC